MSQGLRINLVKYRGTETGLSHIRLSRISYWSEINFSTLWGSRDTNSVHRNVLHFRKAESTQCVQRGNRSMKSICNTGFCLFYQRDFVYKIGTRHRISAKHTPTSHLLHWLYTKHLKLFNSQTITLYNFVKPSL